MSKYQFPQTSQHKDMVEIAPEEMGETMVKLFGKYAVQFEQAHFTILESMCSKLTEEEYKYHGGMWKAYTNHRHVFFMVPPEGEYRIMVPGNGYDGVMSAQAAGLVTSIVAINKLLWHTYDKEHDKMFHALKRYALNHKEHAAILSAID